MFNTIKEAAVTTAVYQFGAATRTEKRAAAAKHANEWWFIALGITITVSAVAFFMVVKVTLVNSMNLSPDQTPTNDQVGGIMLSIAPWMAAMVLSSIPFGYVAEIRNTRQKIVKHELRDKFVVDTDFSFRVMFPNGSAINLSNTALKTAIDEFLANPEVIKADAFILKSTTKRKRAVKEYEAKLLVINLAQAKYLTAHLHTHAILEQFEEIRTAVDKEMHPQLQEALNSFDLRRRHIQDLVTRSQKAGAVS